MSVFHRGDTLMDSSVESGPNKGFPEKVQLFSEEFLQCCIYLCKSQPDRETFTQGLYAKMSGSSQLLEDFLDLNGAKNNSKWYFYRELVSSVRNLSGACYTQKHIAMRLPMYNLTQSPEFEAAGYDIHKFLITCLRTVCILALNESGKVGINMPRDAFAWEDFPGLNTSGRLDANIDDEDVKEEKRGIVKVTTEFLRSARDFEMHAFYKIHSPEEILSIVPGRINEEEARRFETSVHSLQSCFDTYVNRRGNQFRDSRLRTFRGHVSIVLHLLELARRLLHYYERHLFEVGYKSLFIQVRERLSLAVNPEKLVDCIVNYCLYYASHFLTTGRELAQGLLNSNMERGAITVGVPKEMGFHSRPSLLVAKIVQHYGGQVELCLGQDRFDASSVLDIQWAGGKIRKENIQQVVLEGDTRALKDLEVLAGVNYGEDSMGKGISLPKALCYLRT